VEQHVNWIQVLMNGLVVTVPLLLGGYVGWKKLWWTLTEYRPHLHSEEKGTLKAECIHYPRSMNGERK
jgi:hypothetical protein